MKALLVFFALFLLSQAHPGEEASDPTSLWSGQFNVIGGCNPGCCCFTGPVLVNGVNGTIYVSGALAGNCGNLTEASLIATLVSFSTAVDGLNGVILDRVGQRIVLSVEFFFECSSVFECQSGSCLQAPPESGGPWQGRFSAQPSCNESLCCCLDTITAWQDGNTVGYIAKTKGPLCLIDYHIGLFNLLHPTAGVASISAGITLVRVGPALLEVEKFAPMCSTFFLCQEGQCNRNPVVCDYSMKQGGLLACVTQLNNATFDGGSPFDAVVPAILAVEFTGIPTPVPPHTKLAMITGVQSSAVAPSFVGLMVSAGLFSGSHFSLLNGASISQSENPFFGTLWADDAFFRPSTFPYNGLPATFLRPQILFQSAFNMTDFNTVFVLTAVAYGNAAGTINQFGVFIDFEDQCNPNPCGEKICVDGIMQAHCLDSLSTCTPGLDCFGGFCEATPLGSSCTCYPGYEGPSCLPSNYCTKDVCFSLPNRPISDKLPPATSTLTLIGRPPFNPSSKIFLNLNITHDYSDDLIILLTHENVTVTLARNKGSQYRNVYEGVGFYDQAPYGIVDFIFKNDGVNSFAFRPMDPLADFLSTNPNGDWTLTVIDTAAGDSGVLNSWQFGIDSQDSCIGIVPPPGNICEDGLFTYNFKCPSGWAGQFCNETANPCVGFQCFFGYCAPDNNNNPSCNCYSFSHGEKCEILDCSQTTCFGFAFKVFISNDVPPATASISKVDLFGSTIRSDVRIRVTTGLQHSYANQLTIVLISPDGRIARLSERLGGPYNDVFFGTEWYDGASNDVTTYSFHEGVTVPELKPQDNFANTFAGAPVQGIWTLKITDSVVGGDGHLESWTLTIDNEDYCLSNPCGHGTCENVFKNFRCNCAGTGYTGPTCAQRIYCAPETTLASTWARAPALSTAFGRCNAGFAGKPKRTCDENGAFGPIIGDCVLIPPECSAETFGKIAWPTTGLGVVATGVCPIGFGGNPTRQCLPTGVWSTTISSPCTQNVCGATTEGNAQWSSVKSGVKTYGHCLPGFTGTVFRFCQANGTFGPITWQCRPLPSDCVGEKYAKATWPTTAPGATANGVCIPGYTGSPKRICQKSGIWQTFVSNNCQQIKCPATSDGITEFREVVAGTQVLGKCLAGTTGRPIKVCSLSGVPTVTGTPCS